jgi:hypothetical protein
MNLIIIKKLSQKMTYKMQLLKKKKKIKFTSSRMTLERVSSSISFFFFCAIAVPPFRGKKESTIGYSLRLNLSCSVQILRRKIEKGKCCNDFIISFLFTHALKNKSQKEK